MVNYSSKRILTFASLFVGSVLTFSALSVAFPIAHAKALDATPTCASNQILHFTAPGGTPNSLSILTASNDGAFSMSSLTTQAFNSVYPFFTDEGTPDTHLTAVDWVKHNANYSHWEFNIRPGLKWSDGTPVTAADLVGTYNPTESLNAKFDSDNAHSYIKSERAENASTAIFYLNQTNAHLDSALSSILENGLFNSAMYSHGGAYPGFGITIPQLGPFYEVPYTLGQPFLTMYANPYFTPKPAICEMQVNFVETAGDVPTYLLSGQSDAGQIEAPSLQAVLSHPNLHVYAAKYHISEDLSYNITTYPYNMTAFRQALAYSINQTELQQSIFNGYYVTAYNAEGGIPDVNKALYNPSQMTYSFDPAKSLSLLASIGMKPGKDGFLQYRNGTDITINLWADDAYTTNVLAALDVQGQLSNLGFKVDTHETTYSNLAADWSAGAFGVNTKALILHPSDGYIQSLPYSDASPGWGFAAPSLESNMKTWEWPQNIQQQFLSDVAAYTGSSDPTVDNKAIQDIQLLNAQYLPSIIIGFPDQLWAYSTSNWTNWPTHDFYYYGHVLNVTELALLQPASGSSSGGGTGTSPTSSADLTTYALIAVAAVVVVIGIAIVLRRRPGRT